MATKRKLPADIHPETLSRLPPLRREDLNETQQKTYDALTKPPQPGGLNLAGIKGPGGVQMRMPKLGKSFGEVNRILRSELGLDPRLVEVAILATAREMSSQFEWAMHEPVAIEKGIAPQSVDIIRHRKPVVAAPEQEAALIELRYLRSYDPPLRITINSALHRKVRGTNRERRTLLAATRRISAR